MNNKIYCKAGRVELTEEQAYKIYNDKKYIVTSYGIFQPFYSQAGNQVYFQQISIIKGLAKRGRFHTLTGDEINHVLGYEYLRNL